VCEITTVANLSLQISAMLLGRWGSSRQLDSGLSFIHSLGIVCLVYCFTPSMSVPIPSLASIRASPDSFENSGGIVTAEWRVHFPHKDKYFIGVFLASEDVLNTAPIK
jgi:hypothetical protein